MAITASDVNKLRQQTGAGMMDCKNALTEANGDFEMAVDILRKKDKKSRQNAVITMQEKDLSLPKLLPIKKQGLF